MRPFSLGGLFGDCSLGPVGNVTDAGAAGGTVTNQGANSAQTDPGRTDDPITVVGYDPGTTIGSEDPRTLHQDPLNDPRTIFQTDPGVKGPTNRSQPTVGIPIIDYTRAVEPLGGLL